MRLSVLLTGLACVAIDCGGNNQCPTRSDCTPPMWTCGSCNHVGDLCAPFESEIECQCDGQWHFYTENRVPGSAPVYRCDMVVGGGCTCAWYCESGPNSVCTGDR